MRLIVAALLTAAMLAACGGDDDSASQSASPDGLPTALQVSSTYFNDGEEIPAEFSCDGSNESPDVNWTAAPAATQSFAVTMLDPDAGDFVHWVVYGIPKTATGIPQGATDEGELSNGGRQGENSRGDIGYTGPCPPEGTHSYVFTVYALDTEISFASGATLETVQEAMEGHILASDELTGRFSR